MAEGLDTVAGGDTFALYRVRGRCCGRAQDAGHRPPPHAYIHRHPCPPTLIQQSPASREKSQAKSRSPLFLGATL